MNKPIISNEYKALKYDIYKTRKKSKERFVIKIIIFILLFTAVLITTLYLFSPVALGNSNEIEAKPVVVREGDNLWKIAKEYANGNDIRKVLYDIRIYNNIEDSHIYPGMVILIPGKYV